MIYQIFLENLKWDHGPDEGPYGVSSVHEIIEEAVVEKEIPNIKNNEFISKKRDKSLPRWKR